MAIDGVSAVGAVGKSLEIGATGETGATGAPSATQGTSFVDALGKAASDAIGTVQTGEAAAIQGLQGGMAPYKVVDSIMGAQRTLQSMLAIRDKAVSAYQEISRMAI
jgi:flagellar hook-basal body complex protein FliE